MAARSSCQHRVSKLPRPMGSRPLGDLHGNLAVYLEGMRRYPIAYYFHTRRRNRSLPAMLRLTAETGPPATPGSCQRACDLWRVRHGSRFPVLAADFSPPGVAFRDVGSGLPAPVSLRFVRCCPSYRECDRLRRPDGALAGPCSGRIPNRSCELTAPFVIKSTERSDVQVCADSIERTRGPATADACAGGPMRSRFDFLA
jgi:hypothetical protein